MKGFLIGNESLDNIIWMRDIITFNIADKGNVEEFFIEANPDTFANGDCCYQKEYTLWGYWGISKDTIYN